MGNNMPISTSSCLSIPASVGILYKSTSQGTEQDKKGKGWVWRKGILASPSIPYVKEK
jgi:hypothetical protein